MCIIVSEKRIRIEEKNECYQRVSKRSKKIGKSKRKKGNIEKSVTFEDNMVN